MAKFRVMICQFPGNGLTSMHTSPWLLETYIKMRLDPQIGEGNVELWQMADTPVDMSRNRALVAAKNIGCDFVLMLDSDMIFDMPYEGAKPFWDVAWPFALQHNGPCVIAAPYCGPPPNENVYVFRFESTEGNDPNPNFKLQAYDRHHAAELKGIQRVAALPTGLMLIDMRAVDRIPHPRFYYEWTDETHTHKASTEDVTFSRDLSYAGVPLYCTWDSWAAHIKQKMVGKPYAIPPESVPQWLTERSKQLPTIEEKRKETRKQRKKLLKEAELVVQKAKAEIDEPLPKKKGSQLYEKMSGRPEGKKIKSPKPEMMQRGTASRSDLK